jgi:glycosyltransferase involved in cell wall biosynthesis
MIKRNKTLKSKIPFRKKRPAVAVIVSIRNCADTVEAVHAGLGKALDDLGKPYEMVFVDDASTDGTAEKLAGLARNSRHLTFIRMRSIFGEAAALDAGLKYSSGETVVFLSGRVNVNPADVPRLVRGLEKGKDLVAGRRHPRRDSVLNRLVSRLFNQIASTIFKVRLHDIHSGIFATTRSVLRRVSFYGDLYVFIPILAAQQGYRIGEEAIEQLPGSFRLSKYPREYMKRSLDMVTVFFLARYSKKPIHFLGFVGSVFIFLGLGILVYLFIYRILQMGGIAGRPLLVLGALFLVIGVQMISIGLLGEMIIFTHAGDIEEYNIEEIINA